MEFQSKVRNIGAMLEKFDTNDLFFEKFQSYLSFLIPKTYPFHSECFKIP